MANTGNLVTVTLVSVRTDITNPADPHYQETLDVNGYPTRLSGAAPLTKTNVYTDPDYISPYQNLVSCPLSGTTTTTTLAPLGTTSTTSTTTSTTTVGGGGCFIAGTLINMFDGTFKPIEDISVNDIVLSLNSNNELVANKVLETMVHNVEESIRLTINNTLSITTTTEHPFKVGDKYKPAGDLKVGNKLTYLIDGKIYQVVLNNVDYISGDVKVYNITTDPDHTYFAGGIAVHNKVAAP